jgi:ADP-heptose:LPS heptosyltransferase
MKERGNRILRFADRWLGIPIIALLGALSKRRSVPEAIDVVGILMFGVIGDTIFAASLARAIKMWRPNVTVVALVAKSNAGAIDLVDGIDEVMVVPVGRPLKAMRIVRARKFDVLIDTSQWPRIGAVLTVTSRSRYTIGFRTDGQCRHYAYDAVVKHSRDRHEVDNFRQLLRPLGIAVQVQPSLRHDLTGAFSTLAGLRYVVFHPWATGFRSELREWPTERWVALAYALEGMAECIVITGGKGDRAASERLAAAIARPALVRVLAGETSLADLTRVLANAQAVVSVNTGTMHIAALLNRPLVALHGPTDPRRWGPIGDSAVVVGPGPGEGGAYLNLGFEYPRHAENCMAKISVADVMAPLQAMLAGSQRRPPVSIADSSADLSRQGRDADLGS